jgi:uncharacterized protein with PQ loop repeat
MDAAVVLGWMGSALFLARLVPQPVRLWRQGVSHGVSVQAAVNTMVSDVGWLGYGLVAGLPPVWVCATLAIPLDIWTTVLLRHKMALRTAVFGVGWVAVLAAGWVLGGAVGLGSVLGASVLVNQAPQVWTALRGDRLGGIAPATWMIAIADAGLWGGYGLLVGDPALIAYGSILLASSLIVLFRLGQVGGWAALRPGLPDGLVDSFPDPIEPL